MTDRSDLQDQALDQIEPDTANRINRLQYEGLQHFLGHAREVGQLLTEVKGRLTRGMFQPWVKRHCCFSYRTAAAYMQVAANWEVVQLAIAADMQAPAPWTLERALKLLASLDRRADTHPAPQE